MIHHKTPIVLLILALILASCYKDSLEEVTGETIIPSPEITMSVQGDILGYVYDDQGEAVSGASVYILGFETETNAYGVFKFQNVELDPNGTYLKVVKSGYMLGSDMIYATENTTHLSRVHLFRLDDLKVINSTIGGSVTVEGGGQISFTENSIATINGSSYNGDVQVAASRISTGDPFLGDKMPGDLIAQTSEGRTVVLGSMGMIAVELRDPNGNQLNLKEGASAEVIFPILPEQQTFAPNEIALWYFDQIEGRWKEEGKAEKDGTNYRARLNHFSFWNCDVPFPLTSVCGKVVYADGSPAPQTQIQITTDGFGVGWGLTNADGTFGGKIPLDQVLQIKIYNAQCEGDQFIKKIEVGPFSSKATLDDIIIPMQSEGSFEGQVLCSGQAIADAVIMFSFDGFTYFTESDEDGAFKVNLNNFCGDSSNLSVFAIDPDSGKASLGETIDVENNQYIELDVCNSCSFTAEIATDLSADSCNQRIIMANVTGNGNYSYLWSDGSTNESFQVVDEGQYCVTVTDIDLLCSIVRCSDESSFELLNGVLETKASCNGEDGTIKPLISGGRPPYAYVWSDPNIIADPIQLLIGIKVPSGTYGITVTDSNGCSIELETIIEAVSGFTATIESEKICYGEYLTAKVTGGSPPYSYDWDDKVTFENLPEQETALVLDDSGNYCVDISDANGCTITICKDVVILDHSSYEYVDISHCEKGLYTFTHNSLHNDDITLNYNNNQYTIPVAQSIQIDLIPGEIGSASITLTNTQALCDKETLLIPVPHIRPFSENQDSLEKTYSITQKTCSTCDDGGVTLNNNFLFYEKNFGAKPGGLLILDANYNDVSTQATANSLGSGTYFVVAWDSNTGCFIYSEKITID